VEEGAEEKRYEGESQRNDEDEQDSKRLREELNETQERLESKNEELESLREQVVERDERIEELESRIKQIRADFENYKKRSYEKVDRAAERATEKVITDFLGVRDDLERALNSEGDIDDLRDGIEMTLETMSKVFQDHGVERIGVENFDPQEHEAVARVESSEHEKGEVVDVYEHGYERNGSVLREAKVTVAEGDEEKNPARDKESNDR